MFKRWKKTSANHRFAKSGKYSAWIYDWTNTTQTTFEVVVQRTTPSAILTCANYDMVRITDMKSAKKLVNEYAKQLSKVA